MKAIAVQMIIFEELWISRWRVMELIIYKKYCSLLLSLVNHLPVLQGNVLIVDLPINLLIGWTDTFAPDVF